MKKKIIEVRDLKFSYPEGTEALCGIDLDIFEGESVGLIGPNGAGKSTFLLHLNGILRGNSRIKILDLAVNEENLKSIRAKVGVVFQDPESQLFMPTVFDDVSFGPLNMRLSREDVDKAVRRALDEVDMSDFAARSPHHLSFGEKKRISLATVLSMDPELLALDEPTSNLDPKHRRELINLLKKLGHTKIIATHDLELVTEICSRAVLLDDGKLIAEGPVKEILSNKDLLEKHSLEMPFIRRQ